MSETEPILDRYLRLPDVIALVAMSRSAIYRRLETKTFPVPFELGGGQVRWLESEIVAWMKGRPRSRAARRAAKRNRV